MTTNASSFVRALSYASRDQVDGALSSAAVPRGGLWPPTPPLCRCAKCTVDLILQAWLAFDRRTSAMLAALALGLIGVATLRRRPKAGGQSRSQSARVPGRNSNLTPHLLPSS
jgi:hypothetical protein